jgi:hypothetical protein
MKRERNARIAKARRREAEYARLNEATLTDPSLSTSLYPSLFLFRPHQAPPTSDIPSGT